MNCPVDNETLQMSERQGVEVDYCPRCRGVWLDRGELDKIIERTEREGAFGGYPDDRDDRDDRGFRDDRGYRDDRDFGDEGRRDPYRQRRKKRSFLSEMFEFGGDD